MARPLGQPGGRSRTKHAVGVYLCATTAQRNTKIRFAARSDAQVQCAKKSTNCGKKKKEKGRFAQKLRNFLPANPPTWGYWPALAVAAPPSRPAGGPRLGGGPPPGAAPADGLAPSLVNWRCRRCDPYMHFCSFVHMACVHVCVCARARVLHNTGIHAHANGRPTSKRRGRLGFLDDAPLLALRFRLCGHPCLRRGLLQSVLLPQPLCLGVLDCRLHRSVPCEPCAGGWVAPVSQVPTFLCMCANVARKAVCLTLPPGSRPILRGLTPMVLRGGGKTRSLDKCL